MLYCWKRIEAHSLSILKTKTINNTANKSAEQTEQLEKMGDNFYKQMMEIGQRDYLDTAGAIAAYEEAKRMMEEDSMEEEDSRKM